MPLQANWFHVLNPSGGLRATPVALTPVAMLTASSTAALEYDVIVDLSLSQQAPILDARWSCADDDEGERWVALGRRGTLRHQSPGQGEDAI